MLPLLAGAVGVPVQASECLTPLRWLLEHIDDGVTVRQGARLPKALVREANDRVRLVRLYRRHAQN
jgi:hypothetical protein